MYNKTKYSRLRLCDKVTSNPRELIDLRQTRDTQTNEGTFAFLELLSEPYKNYQLVPVELTPIVELKWLQRHKW